jgi:hypothetical protein
MMMWQDSASVRQQLKKHGVRFEVDFVLKSNSKLYIRAEIFLNYIRTVFLPDLAELRTLDEFAEGIGVSLMDNCANHVIDDVIHLLTEARVQLISFASHTTQLFQVFHVTLFNVVKRQPRYELAFRGDKETVKFIMKGCRDFK